MADANRDERNPEEELEAKPGKKKRKLMIVIAAAVVVLGGVGAFAAMKMMGGADGENPDAHVEQEYDPLDESDSSHGKADAHEASDGHGKEEKSDSHGGGHGGIAETAEAETVEVPEDTFQFASPFVVTLADTRQKWQLHFIVTVELAAPELVDVFETRNARFRDAIISEVSGRRSDEVRTSEGIERLRRDLARRFEALLDQPGAVRAVLFPDYIVH